MIYSWSFANALAKCHQNKKDKDTSTSNSFLHLIWCAIKVTFYSDNFLFKCYFFFVYLFLGASLEDLVPQRNLLKAEDLR